ncbi:MAG: GtrA family protein [Rhizobiaceae bacterium]|nr:GtrA family protein [Rhizobiaceae bacterium]
MPPLNTIAARSSARSSDRARRRPLTAWTAALAATLLLVGVNWLSGNSLLSDGRGDNDSLMRLVEIRDLVAGQGWFDLHQYRMGPAGGIVMHWSRLVDAPLAALVLAGSALTGSQATGEAVALVLWPTLLAFAALWLLIRLAGRLAGDAALLPAALVGAMALFFVATFRPGAIDHHNLQLVLLLATMLQLSQADAAPRRALGAGVLTAAMLAIGMESVPFVAVAGLWCAGLFLFRGERAVPLRFGLGFAGGSAIAFVATVPPSGWFDAACDAFSAPHLLVAAVSGVGLALAAHLGGRSLGSRALGLAVIGLAAGAVLAGLFPDCLRDPYSTVDPRLRDFWLNWITEALPVWTILATRTKMAFAYYVTPMIGLAWLVADARRRGLSRTGLLAGTFLMAAFLMSLWQVRGAMFAIPLAVVPLAAWITTARQAAAQGGRGVALRLAVAWLVSINAIWAAGANHVAGLLRQGDAARGAQEARGASCYAEADHAALAALPATTVLTISNLGAAILRFTPHHAIAGPYHRNVDGNLLVLNAFMGDAEAARQTIRENGVGLVAFCPGNDESGVLAGWAPDGFMADLRHGRVPAWLEAVPGTEAATLRLYRPRRDD